MAPKKRPSPAKGGKHSLGSRRYVKRTSDPAKVLADAERQYWEQQLRRAGGSIRGVCRNIRLGRTSVTRHLNRVGLDRHVRRKIWEDLHPLRQKHKSQLELPCSFSFKERPDKYGRNQWTLYEGKGGWERNALLAIACIRKWRKYVDKQVWVRLWDKSKVGPFVLRLDPTAGLYFERK